MERSQVVLFAPMIQTLRDPCEVTAYVQSTVKSRLDKQASLIQDGVPKILFWFPNYQKLEGFFKTLAWLVILEAESNVSLRQLHKQCSNVFTY